MPTRPALVVLFMTTSRDYDSDHLPISTALTWDWQAAAPVRKRLWAKTDFSKLRQTVKEGLAGGSIKDLGGKHDLNERVQFIVKALQAGIDASTPWSNPSPRSVSGFGPECKDICTEVRQLRRRWQRTVED